MERARQITSQPTHCADSGVTSTGEANDQKRHEDSPLSRKWLNGALGEGRLHLAALDAVLVHRSAEPLEVDRPYGLGCGVVSRGGAAPVLNVIDVDRPERSVDVKAERVGGRWWYLDAKSGEGLVPVDEVDKAPAALARVLARGVQ